MSTPHPVKQEIFDVATMNNVDPKGFNRPVDSYRTTDFGLYMARGADHRRFGYLESWLLPNLGLRVNIFHERTRADQWNQDYYVDIARSSRDGDTWRTEDLYLDISCTIGQEPVILDTDEVIDALTHGVISAADARWALDTCFTAATGIAAHNGDPVAWLASRGYNLTWAEQVELVPAAKVEAS